MKRLLSLVTILFLAVVMIGCDDMPTSTDQKVSQQQAQLTSEANKQTGMPGITNFTEMKIVKKLYELRDQQISTYSYVTDMNGNLHFVCSSIGYGLPYGVQFSNPERHAPNEAYTQSGYNIPQAEPNGLFMPPTAEGTWVICAGEKAGDIRPVYIEPRVIVSPFKLHSVSEYQETK